MHPKAAADLGDDDERSPAAGRAALLPQASAAELGRGLGAQQQGPAGDGHRSLENGHRSSVPESAIKAGDGEHLSNGGGVGAAVAVKQQEVKNKDRSSSTSSGGGAKKPRGPGVLQEGSRCSRKNGRGWRCSQPTLVGYALCQYHLGKGRVRSAGAAGGRSAGQLGCTEHVKREPAAAAVFTAAAAAPAPKADDVPTPTHG